MGVIGLVVASIVNIFLASPALVFCDFGHWRSDFAGLTAYDTPKYQEHLLAHAHHGDQEWLPKNPVSWVP